MTGGNVWSVAFSPDGKTLAAGYDAGRVGGVVLWDTVGRERVQEQPLAVTGGNVWSVAFSPDGKTLAAGFSVFGSGGGVVQFDIDLTSCAAKPVPSPTATCPERNGRSIFPISPIGRLSTGFRLLRARSRTPRPRLRLLPRLRLRGRIERMDPKPFRIRILSLDGGAGHGVDSVSLTSSPFGSSFSHGV